jgi:hypothetical protein
VSPAGGAAAAAAALLSLLLLLLLLGGGMGTIERRLKVFVKSAPSHQ